MADVPSIFTYSNDALPFASLVQQPKNLNSSTNFSKTHQTRLAGRAHVFIHVFNSLLSTPLKPSSHHQWRASRAWDHKEFSPLLIGKDVQDLGFHPFFLVSKFGVVAPTDTSVGMDPGAGETVD